MLSGKNPFFPFKKRTGTHGTSHKTMHTVQDNFIIMKLSGANLLSSEQGLKRIRTVLSKRSGE